MAFEYNVVFTNCQDIAKALIYYARHPLHYGRRPIITYLFPQTIADRILKILFISLPGTQVFEEIALMIME